MKFIKQNFIYMLSIVIFLLLIFVYIFSQGRDTDIYTKCLNIGVILIFGYSTYEFNRLSKIPALNVKKDSIEQVKKIVIENLNDYPAKRVYIGSFLTMDNGELTPLYEEIQSQITKHYPIEQTNILNDNFRKNFEDEDKKEYGSTLKERWEQFIKKVSPKNYLVIVLRNYLMTKDETLLFFFECSLSDQNSLDTLSFKSKHFSTKTTLYRNSLEKITKKYQRYCRKYG